VKRGKGREGCGGPLSWAVLAEGSESEGAHMQNVKLRTPLVRHWKPAIARNSVV